VSWIVDGNNVLGRLRVPRDAAESKRALVRLLSSFARAKRTKVVCCFDGAEPEHFGKQLGGVSVIFSGARSADELIAARATRGSKVVTADRGLAGRVAGRHVTIVDPVAFAQDLESLPVEPEAAAAEDWIAYFSDDKNRADF
jgi:hypothetical protein